MSITAIKSSFDYLCDKFSSSHFKPFVSGFIKAAPYLELNEISKEFEQGKNNYPTYFSKGLEFVALSSTVKQFASEIFNYKKVNPKISCYFGYGLTLAQISAIPASLILAFLKQNNTKKDKVINKSRFFHLLETNAPSFSTFSKAVLLTSLVSALYFKPLLFVSGFSLRWLYHELKTHECISSNIVHQLENSYFSKAAIATLDATQLFSGFSINNLFIGFYFLATVFPTQFNRLLTYPSYIILNHISFGVRSIYVGNEFVEGASISYKELIAPLKKNQLSTKDIFSILTGSEVKINPAHCSKKNVSFLDKNETFEHLLLVFNQLDWEKEHQVVDLAVKSDNRFKEDRKKSRKKIVMPSKKS